MDANFAPNLVNPVGVDGFMFWCQKVLPLVYDDSLSYYEVLCKIKGKLNEVIQNSNIASENAVKLNEAYKKLEDYVNNYFNSSNIPEMVDDTLNRMKEDGSLYEYVISRITAQDIGARPDTWLPTLGELGAMPIVGVTYNDIVDGQDASALPRVLTTLYDSMPDYSIKFNRIGFTPHHPVLGGATFLVKVFRHANNYGFASFETYSATRFYMTYTDGSWGRPFILNSILSPGATYLTGNYSGSKQISIKTINVNVNSNGVFTGTIRVPHGIANFGYIVSANGKSGIGLLPNISTTGNISIYRVDASDIILTLNNYNTNNAIYSFTLEYCES